MASESRPKAQDMVTRGLLPENLPPTFSAQTLGSLFGDKAKVFRVDGKTVGALAHYNASKRGEQRRMFGMPHPLFVWEQGLFFEQQWNLLQEKLDGATGSLSRPTFPPDGDRAVLITPHSKLPFAKLKALSGFKYCLVTDVARCYASIYTHAICWAAHTRDKAKKERDPASATLVANRLDFLVRQAQDGQTVGIPVGPDSSRIVCELILSAVDRAFIEASPSRIAYLRHVDDYWIGGHSLEECERHLSTLRSALRKYELDVNELKTKIVPTSEVLSDGWPAEIEKEISEGFGQTRATAGGDPVATISRLLDRATRDKDDGIVKLAIRKIDRQRLWMNNWEVLEHFLILCAVQFPHSLDYVARVIAWRARTASPIDKQAWKEIALRIATIGSDLGRDSEVVWALWLLKELKIKVPSTVASSVAKNSGPLVLAYLAHLHAHGYAGGKSLVRDLQYRVEGSLWAGQYWPLTLELRHLDLWPTTWEKVQKGRPICVLHEAQASLISWDALPKVFDDQDDEVPDHAIEQSSSYDDLEEHNEDTTADLDRLVDGENGNGEFPF